MPLRKIKPENEINKSQEFYNPGLKRIIETYRKSRPDAIPPDIFVAISSVIMMGLGSIDSGEKI